MNLPAAIKKTGLVWTGAFCILVSSCGKKPDLSGLYVRDPVFFEVETSGGAKRILSELHKYSRMFAFPPVESEGQARYRISGTIVLKEIEPVEREDGTLRYRYRLDAELRLFNTKSGRKLETFSLPHYLIGEAGKEEAFETMVRAGTEKLAQFVFYDGKALGQPDIRNLCADLVIESDKLYNDIVEKLVAEGKRAVPYLIWKMGDTRPVLLRGDLPSIVKEEDASKVRVCHVADYALERILERKTALTVHSSKEYIRRVQRGWFRRWREVCGAFLRGEKLKKLLATRQ